MLKWVSFRQLVFLVILIILPFKLRCLHLISLVVMLHYTFFITHT